MVEINRCYNENCLDTMVRMPDEFIDLVITSPPYDNLRTYHGYSFDFEPIAQELYRVVKKGGVVVWVIADATINGSETGTSFQQAIYFKEIGFNLHDTMIWEKPTFTATGALIVRYAQVFEYMFVFTKGKIKTFNPIKDRPTKGIYKKSGTIRNPDGTTRRESNIGKIYSAKVAQRFNVWHMGTENSKKNRCHPAQFPEQLANDHIVSWSNEGDLVYDPFMGSGTVAKMAILNNRNWIGSEISKEYCEIIDTRIKNIAYIPLLPEMEKTI